jgi:hypothetical protein
MVDQRSNFYLHNLHERLFVFADRVVADEMKLFNYFVPIILSHMDVCSSSPRG